MSNNTITISPCTPATIPRSYEIFMAAFGHSAPFVEAFYPGHGDPEVDAKAVARLTRHLENDRASMYLNAWMDGQIVGYAVWSRLLEPPPVDLAKLEDVEAVWPDEKDRGFAMALWRELAQVRVGVVEPEVAKGKGVYVLDFLAVHPSAQRRGIGERLVKYGTDLADKEGFECLVEGTPEKMKFDVGEEFSDRALPVLTFLVREPVQQGQ